MSRTARSVERATDPPVGCTPAEVDGPLEGVRPSPRDLWRIVAVYATSRLVVLGAVAGGRLLRPDLDADALQFRLDGGWYRKVVDMGYSATAATPATADDPSVLAGAFFPLFPMLARIATWFGLSTEAALVLVATVAGAVSCVVVWTLVARISGRRAADRAVVAFAVFPGAVTLSMVYAEPVMLVCAGASLTALVDGRWTAAGLWGALASAARPNGLAVAAACAWAAWVAVRRGDARAVVAPLLAPLGFVAHLSYLWLRTGEPDAWLRIQRLGWGEQIDGGVRTLERIGATFAGGAHPQSVLHTLTLLVVVLGAVAVWRWRPPAPLVVYSVVVLGLALGSQLGARPRFLWTAFPFVVAMGVVTDGLAHRLLLVVFGGGLATLAVVYIVASAAMP